MAEEETTATAAAPESDGKAAGEGKYVRVERSNRVTKATLGIYDAEHPDNTVFDKANGRWAVFCVTHNQLRQVKSLAQAWQLHAAPWDFCSGCAEIQAKRATAEPTKQAAGSARKANDGTLARGVGPSGKPERPVARPNPDPNEAPAQTGGDSAA